MSTNWTLYEQMLGNYRENAINNAVDSLLSGLVDDPAYQNDTVVQGVITPLVASRQSTTECSIKAFPETNIHIGDIVECRGDKWIVVELYTDKIGMITGKMWLCNSEIKFQSGTTTINTRSCVVDNGTYSKKSSDPDAFVMANTYKLYLSIDNDTERLHIDKRLSLGEIYSSSGEKILEVYKIIGIDMKSQNFGNGSHLMVVTLQRDVYNAEADSLSDGVCDMLTESNSEYFPSISGNFAISGRDSIRIGTTRTYYASCVDSNGNEIKDIETIWSVSAPSGAVYEVVDCGCVLTIPLDELLVGESVLISVHDAENLYGSCTKKVQVITIG